MKSSMCFVSCLTEVKDAPVRDLAGRRPWRRTQGRGSRTRIYWPPDQVCGPAGPARPAARGHRPTPRPSAGPSSGRTRPVADDPEPPPPAGVVFCRRPWSWLLGPTGQAFAGISAPPQTDRARHDVHRLDDRVASSRHRPPARQFEREEHRAAPSSAHQYALPAPNDLLAGVSVSNPVHHPCSRSPSLASNNLSAW
jgi:hypothetical protein